MPTPISARPRANCGKSSALAKSALPATATSISAGVVQRGPHRSNAAPSGICTAANAAKNRLVINPSASARRPSSRARSGAITALAERKKNERKYAAVKARKTVRAEGNWRMAAG